MTFDFDHVNALFVLFATVILGVAYTMRLALRGRTHFERAERPPASFVFGRGLSEMAHFLLLPLARALVELKVRPTEISWVALVLGGSAGVFLTYGYFGIGALIALLSVLANSLDGMVAQLGKQSTDANQVLDATVNRYVELFFLTGLALYYREFIFLQLLVVLAILGSFMVAYSSAKAEALNLSPPSGVMERPERAFYLILGAALSALPVHWLGANWNFPIQLGLPMIISLGFVAVLTNISAVERLSAIAKAVETPTTRQQPKADTKTEMVDDRDMVPHHHGF